MTQISSSTNSVNHSQLSIDAVNSDQPNERSLQPLFDRESIVDTPATNKAIVATVGGGMSVYQQTRLLANLNLIDLGIETNSDGSSCIGSNSPLHNLDLDNEDDIQTFLALLPFYKNKNDELLNKIFLKFVVESNNVELAKKCIEMGADCNYFEYPECDLDHIHSALMRAVYYGGDKNLDMISFLIDQGADVNACIMDPSTNLHSALSTAVGEDYFKSVALLLEKGANTTLTHQEGDDSNPIITRASTLKGVRSVEILDYLLSKGAQFVSDVERDYFLFDIVSICCRKCSTEEEKKTAHEFIRCILKLGANPNSGLVDDHIIGFAKQHDDLELVSILMEFASEPYQISGFVHSQEMLELLVSKGAKFESEDAKNVYLFECSRSNYSDRISDEENNKIIKYLLDLGANPNFSNKDGETIFGYVIEQGDLSLAKLLIDYGASMLETIENQDGKIKFRNVFSLARSKEMMQLLVENGCPFDDGFLKKC